MKEVKSSSQKRRIKLPPQTSATDTSNCDNRNVAAPTVDKVTKKRIVRDTVFIRNEIEPDLRPMTLAQIQRLEAKERAKKNSK
jgi:hypothetical protein